MTNENTSLEKYTSHTLFKMFTKGLCVVGELVTEQTATYWPPVPSSLAALLSRSAGLLNRGSWWPIALGWVLVLSTASYLQLTDSKLTELPVAPGYIIVWHPPASSERRICTQLNPSTVKAISWCLRPDAPVTGSKVNMLQHLNDLELNIHVVRSVLWLTCWTAISQKESSIASRDITFTLRLIPFGEKKEYLIPLRNRLNSATIQGWLWHWIYHKSWYAIKQRNKI